MAILELESLWSDLTPEAPCGDNLEYDPDFVALETLLQGKAEAQFGATVIAAEPPDWKAARTLLQGLLTRSRDLRLAVHLSRALLALEGLEGFSEAIALLRGLIERHWPHVHPQLDPSDGNDPVMRVNAIAALCDSAITLNPLRDVWLATAPAHGRFSFRQISFLAGEGSLLSGQEPPQAASLNAAFMDMPLAQLIGRVAAARQAHEDVRAIERRLTDLVGATQALDMAPLASLLGRLHEELAGRLAARPDAPVEVPEAPVEELQAGGAAGPAGAVTPARTVDQVGSRDDVQRVLKRVLDYYRIHEPSSPVPLLIERALRLVPLGFLDIIRELAPDTLGELQKIRGNSAE